MKQQHNRWKLWGAALVVVVAWIGFASVGGPYFGKIEEVSSNDLSTFLPESSESARVNERLESFRDTSTIPAIAVFESDNELTDTEREQLATAASRLDDDSHVAATVEPPIYSEDKKAAFIVAPLESDAEFAEAIDSLKQTIAASGSSLEPTFTGPAMFSRELNKAFSGIDGTLLVVALSVVFVILLVVYRSPLLPVVTLVGAISALATAIFVVWHLADAGIVQLNGQVQGILFILVIGAATDYSLLYIARYREELLHRKAAFDATVAAWKASWEPVVAAGGTVILGLLCLLASDLGSNKALGPVGGLGIVFSMLVALTFLPASLLLLGRKAFWPRIPAYDKSRTQTDYHDSHKVWTRVAGLVSKHPRRLWAGSLVVLVAFCFAVPHLQAQGVSQEDLVLGVSEARDGQQLLNRHFPSGSGAPSYAIVSAENQASAIKVLEQTRGVEAVAVLTDDGQAPVGSAREEIIETIRESVAVERQARVDEAVDQLAQQMQGASQQAIDQASQQIDQSIPSVDELTEQANPFTDTTPKVSDGDIVLAATLSDEPSSLEARQTIERLRTAFDEASIPAEFGGVSAIQLDTNSAADHDLKVIIPLILLSITIVLMLLLRSIVAPLILLATTVVSFGATLGIAAILFNTVWEFPGGDPAIVLFGFVFLVALGIDYNIFLMTRVREETTKLGVRAGTLKALVVTGGVITSAGIVLAATFAALFVIPILFLAQLAFIVSFGVLLDTLLVRSLLVPSLTMEIGRPMWWPSKLWRKGKR